MSQQLTQHEPPDQGLKFRVLIAPTRDRNGFTDCTDHQCYPVLIAPTRDRNVLEHRPFPLFRDVLIAPTRDRNRRSRRHPRKDRRGPHRPYQGSQRHLSVSTQADNLQVLIAPTRDRNMRGAGLSGRGGGPHRPYQGSQHTHQRRVVHLVAGPHRPYQGSQRDTDERRADRRQESSSPLPGIATPGRRGSHRPQRHVLIAPTRDRNNEEGAGR